MSISKHYNWLDTNRLDEFGSWEEEIEHAKGLGYSLVPPEYHLPHWSVKFSLGVRVPNVYVLRNRGMDKISSDFDRKTSEVAYPLFFKDGEGGEVMVAVPMEDAKEYKDLKTSRDWYKKRCEMLGELQKHMRDPERTLVCDILANGMLLPDPKAKRYGFVPERKHI